MTHTPRRPRDRARTLASTALAGLLLAAGAGLGSPAVSSAESSTSVPVSLSVSATKVSPGHDVAVTGKVRGADSGTKVKVWQRIGSKPEKLVGTAKTVAQGRYQTDVRIKGQKDRALRVCASSSNCSPWRTVNVVKEKKYSVTLGASAGSVTPGTAISFSGQVSPALAAPLVLEASAPGTSAWAEVAQAPSASNGAFSASIPAGAVGAWSFRAVLPEAPTSARAVSPTAVVSVTTPTPEVPAFPYDKPAAPAAPLVAKSPASAAQPSAVVSWVAPNGNGDNNLTYTLTARSGQSWAGLTTTSQQVAMNPSENDITFAVTATNKAGTGPASPSSEPVRFFQAPGTVGNLQANETGVNNQVRITFTAAAGNGAKPSEIAYPWRANGVEGALPSGGGLVIHAGAFPNGQNVNVEVWAVSTVRGESVAGSRVSDTVNAYGTPTTPAITEATALYRQVRFSWNGDSTGNGRGVDALFRIDGGGWQSAPVSGSHTVDTGPGQEVSFEVRTQNAAGWGAIAQTSVTSWADSAYAFTRTNTSVVVDGETRYRVNVHLERFRPNSSVFCQVAGGTGAAAWSETYTVDGSGNWGPGATGAAASTDVDMSGFGTCTQQ